MASESINELHSDLFAGDGEEARYCDPQEARKKAMDYLARREYGQQELKKKLAGAGFRTEAVEPAVDQLTADGLQDDRRFAEAFVRSRINQGKGPVRIQADLARRSVPGSLINEALQASGEDWRALARAIRTKKFGTALPESFREKARQMRFLQYRGFLPDHIRAAVGDSDD